MSPDSKIDFAWDLLHVLFLATLLAFIAWLAVGAGWAACGMAWILLMSYAVGRWHAGKGHDRDMALLRSYYRSKLGEKD